MKNKRTENAVCIAGEGDRGKRLDQVLPHLLASVGVEKSRAQIQNWIKQGLIQVNGKLVKKGRSEVETGDRFDIQIPAEQASPELVPEKMDLAILHEDEHIIVVNKAPGIVVHPGAGNSDGTLVNGLLHHCEGKLSELADEGRPGIVHRLDKETSGCLIAAKTDLAYESLVGQFSGRKTEKHYLAIVEGKPAESSGRLETHIGRHPVQRQRMAIVDPPAGKLAITDFKVRHSEVSWSWIDCQIHTGRTHQIRVHLKEGLRCPILGDTIYAKPSRQKNTTGRLMLHAHRLSVSHPASGERLTFEAPFPEEFERFSL